MNTSNTMFDQESKEISDINLQRISKEHRVTIIKKLDESDIGSSYFATSDSDGKKLLIKIFQNRNNNKNIEDFIRFRNQIEIISNIQHPNVQRILTGAIIEDVPFTIAEYTTGLSLEKILIQLKSSLSVEQLLRIFLYMCSGLKAAHEKKVAHLELKPSNIIVPIQEKRPIFERLQLIDFGVAQLQSYTIINNDTETIIRNFGYISPEQTGHIPKSKPDERSDIYSLGIILYELLTKTYPYEASNADSLLHQHVARIPDPPSSKNPAVIKILDRIILKMLEKEPSARYQSIDGLVADIEKVLAKQTDFVLGLAEKDKQIRLDFRTPLVGRDEELAILAKGFEKAQAGEGSIILVGADPGQGKTRLVDEIHINNPHPCIGGKFFSGETKSPYLPFKEAISSYIIRFKKYSAAQQSNIQKNILENLGDLGNLLLRFNPEIKEIIGANHPDIPALDTAEKENIRYINTLTQFFITLAKAEKGLIVILDDLQWADAGSMTLLQRISQEITSSNLLILGTYRDKEVSEEHPLTKFIAENSENTSLLKMIALKPLDLIRLTKLVGKLLHTSEQESPEIKDIASFVLKISHGNPFFSIEILKQLERAKEKPLVYQDGHWLFNNKIAGELNIADTSIQIVLNEIAKLPAKEIEVLSIAALIGHKFKADLLFKLIDKTKIPTETIVEIIDHAIELQLIEKDPEGQILFVHDRIREAFYTRLNEQDRKILHAKIAETLDRELTEKEKNEMIFDIAHHFIKAENPEKIIEYVLPAAHKAKELYANDESLQYYQVVLTNTKEQRLHYLCSKNMGELFLNKGNYNEAIKTLKLLLEYNLSLFEKAEISKLLCDAYHHIGAFMQTEEYGKIGLLYLKEKLPTGGIALITSTFKEMLVHFAQDVIFKKKLQKIRNKYNTPEEQARNKLIARFYFTIAWSYAYTNAIKAIRANSKVLNLAKKRIGPSTELAVAMSAVAGPYMILALFDLALNFINKSLEMHKNLDNYWGMGQTYNLQGYTYEWAAVFKKAIESFSTAKKLFEKVGDYREAITSLSGLIHANYCLANYAEEDILRKEHFELVSKSNDVYGICDAFITNLCYFHETGDIIEAKNWGDKSLKLSIENNKPYNICTTYMEYGYLYLDGFKEIILAEEYLKKAKELYDKNNFLKNYSVNIFTYLAELALAKTQQNSSKENLKNSRLAIREALKQTKSWPTHTGGALRVAGKYYALINKKELAEKYFTQSIAHCEKIGRRYELGKSLYEYGLFLENIGQKEKARKTLEKAYLLFKEIGAMLYLKRTAERLGIQIEEKQKNEQFVESIQQKALNETYHDLVSVLSLDELLPKILNLAIKSTGATRGYIFLFNENDRALELKAHSEVSSEDTARYPFGLVEKVFRTGKEIISADAVNDKSLKDIEGLANSNIHSLYCFPLLSKSNGKPIGVCYVDNPTTNFFAEKQKTLEAFMVPAGVALENALLYEAQRKSLEKQIRIVNRSKHMMNAEMVDWIMNQDKEPEAHPAINTEAAIMFTDIRNFTDISEEIGDPEELTRFLNIYLETIAQPLHQLEDLGLADTDKFIGDAMMYILKDPKTSLQAALDMKKMLQKFNAERYSLFDNKPPYTKPIDMGIGIAYGPIMLGLTGHSRRKQFTALGDTVNTGSRIESLTKKYHAPILINEELFKRIDPASFNLRMLDIIRPKGKSNPIKLYEEFSFNSPVVRDLKIETLPQFQELQFAYYHKDFKNALRIAETLIKRFEETIAKYNLDTKTPGDYMPYIYIERIRALEKLTSQELEAWDGVFTFTEK